MIGALALSGAGATAPGPAVAGTLPAGFEEVVLATGLELPTAVDWAPDGRMFVAEKAGVVKVVTPGSAPQATTLLDLSSHVNSYGDRGLLGLAVAHDFARTGHLYLLYTYEINRRRQDARKSSRLTRVTIDPANHVVGKERVILGRDGTRPCKRISNTQDCIPADAPTHTIGTVRAASDGTLWMGTGESTAYSIHYTNVFHASRTDSFAGKLIHVDERGRGLPDHPFCRRDSNLSHVCTKLHAKGFRNPFRFTLRGDTPIVGDVGLETREEIDIAVAGRDYGWPCHEGSLRTPAFETTRRCRRRYARERRGHRTEKPFYEYPGPPATVIVGPVFRGATWPGEYRGRLFFGDYVLGKIQTLDLDSGRAAPFAKSIGAPVDVEQTPRGQLAYVDIGAGEVREIGWSPDNRAPVARGAASRRYGPVPLVVNFSARNSVDPDGDALSYTWDFGDGDTASGRDVQHVYTSAGNRVVRLTASDPGGRSAVALLSVSPGNTPPTVELVAPNAGSLYRAGGNVTLRATADDPEDGPLRGRAISWEAFLDHRGHTHYLLTRLKGALAGFRVKADHSADTFLKLTVVATDSGGLSASKSVSIRPRTTTVRIGSSPRGAPVTFAGTAGTAPVTETHAVGFRTVVSAARTFERDGVRYRFRGWSDAGRREHTVSVPRSGLSLRARYAPAE